MENENEFVGFENAIANVAEYLISVHNALGNIILGTHAENDKLLVVPEEQYLQVMDSLSNQAKALAASVDLVVDNIQSVVEQNKGEVNE